MKPKMRKMLKRTSLGVAVLFLVVQFVRPAKTNPAIDPARTMQSHVQITPEVGAIFERACRDCHSNQTTWPWYSNVAPVSWFVIDHVNQGRRHLNFDDWRPLQRSDPHQATVNLLNAICEWVQRGAMPLDSYIWLHPNAKLSAADIQTICHWTQAEQQRLASQSKK